MDGTEQTQSNADSGASEARRSLRRGDQCHHTEHAIGARYMGRFWPEPYRGGAGQWEPCPNEPSYGAMARAEALAADDPNWMNVTAWEPGRP